VKKSIASVAVAATLLLSAGNGLRAEQLNGGYSLQYAASALTLSKGMWLFKVHSRASLFTVNGTSVSDVTGAFSMNYGFSNNLETEATLILYQDLNYSAPIGGSTANTPDDLLVRWKWGNMQMPLAGLPLYFALSGTARISLGGVSNTYLEPYDSPGTTAQLNMIFSYFRNPIYPNDDLQIHYNFGYINFNDGIDFSSSTSAVRLYFGVWYPFNDKVAASVESHGTYFLGYPESLGSIYSIEEYGYLTPSLHYTFSPVVTFITGADIRIYEKKDLSFALNVPPGAPNYPPWRISSKLVYYPSAGRLGTGGPGFGQYGATPAGAPAPGAPPVGGGYGAASRAALYDWGGNIESDIQYMEIELEKIREDRKKAEEQLQKLKNKLRQKKTKSSSQSSSK